MRNGEGAEMQRERGGRETEKQKNDGLEFSCDRIQQPGQFNADVSYEIGGTRQ